MIRVYLQSRHCPCGYVCCLCFHYNYDGQYGYFCIQSNLFLCHTKLYVQMDQMKTRKPSPDGMWLTWRSKFEGTADNRCGDPAEGTFFFSKRYPVEFFSEQTSVYIHCSSPNKRCVCPWGQRMCWMHLLNRFKSRFILETFKTYIVYKQSSSKQGFIVRNSTGYLYVTDLLHPSDVGSSDSVCFCAAAFTTL